jgi:hypothetical protein
VQRTKDGRRKSSQFVCKLSAAPQLPPPDVQCYLKPKKALQLSKIPVKRRFTRKKHFLAPVRGQKSPIVGTT